MTQLYLDTEFTDLKQTADLVSIGMCSKDGRVFYAEITDYNHAKCSEWVKTNIIPNLPLSTKTNPLTFIEAADVSSKDGIAHGFDVEMRHQKEVVAFNLKRWIKQFSNGKASIEVWADVNPWDWVLFCDLFGSAFNLPREIHYIPLDFATVLKREGLDPDVDRLDLLLPASRDNVIKLHFGFDPSSMDKTAKIELMTQTKHNARFDAIVLQQLFEQFQIKPESK